jgi:hypothetical protein
MNSCISWAKDAGIDFFGLLWTGAGSPLVNWERADELDARVSDHLAVQEGIKVSHKRNSVSYRVILQMEHVCMVS